MIAAIAEKTISSIIDGFISILRLNLSVTATYVHTNEPPGLTQERLMKDGISDLSVYE